MTMITSYTTSGLLLKTTTKLRGFLRSVSQQNCGYRCISMHFNNTFFNENCKSQQSSYSLTIGERCLLVCPGKSKGRSYPPMTDEDQQWLSSYYAPHNARLKELLTRLGRTPPRWLIWLTLTLSFTPLNLYITEKSISQSALLCIIRRYWILNQY